MEDIFKKCTKNNNLVHSLILYTSTHTPFGNTDYIKQKPSWSSIVTKPLKSARISLLTSVQANTSFQISEGRREFPEESEV